MRFTYYNHRLLHYIKIFYMTETLKYEAIGTEETWKNKMKMYGQCHCYEPIFVDTYSHEHVDVQIYIVIKYMCKCFRKWDINTS